MSVKNIFGIMILAMSSTTIAQGQEGAEEKAADRKAPAMETDQAKASYAIGFNIGNDIKSKGLELDPQLIAAGIAAALNGEESALTEAQISAAFAALEKDMRAKSAAKATKNLEVGKKFLEENKSKEGVKVTKSGLQYIVIKEGTGATPTTDSTVTAHYRGTFIDGKSFDGTYEGKEPTEKDRPIPFPVTGVIAGWTEALQLMKVGAHYRLFIPGNLAYGEAGRPGIEPNSVLIFDIHLVDSEG